MQPLKVPPVQDVVRFLRPTISETKQLLVEYYTRKKGLFSYEPARKIAKPLYSGEIGLPAALEGCLTKGNPRGRKSNAEVVELIWQAAQGRSLLCHDLKKRDFAIRRDLAIAVHAPFYFVENGQVKIYWLQPRRGYGLTQHQMGLLGSIIRMSIATEDFEGADIELFDTSIPAGSKTRVPRTFNFADLSVTDAKATIEALRLFAAAYDEVCEMDIPKPAQRDKKRDDRQPPLFD